MTEIVSFFKKVLAKSPISLESPQSSISLIIKRVGVNELDILFIKRTSNIKDKHSGQIAFPGGKLECGETSYDAAIRETYEEIGVTLKEEEYLGHTGLKPAYKGGLRINPMKLTSHLFYLERPIDLKLNPSEIFSYRWVDFKVFTHDLRLYSKPKQNCVMHTNYKTFLNPNGIISGKFPGIGLPQSKYCDSDDKSEYHLWGASFRKIREIVMALPDSLRGVSNKDWVYYNLDWPNKIMNPFATFIDSYFPEKLETKHFII